jgi:flagellar biosynthesis protein
MTRGEAVALAYSAGDQAPRVVAKGRGLIAQEIIERAREAGVFVHESPELVALLMQVDLDEHIPPTLYMVVAELLAWIYQVEKENQPDSTLAKKLTDVLQSREAQD